MNSLSLRPTELVWTRLTNIFVCMYILIHIHIYIYIYFYIHR